MAEVICSLEYLHIQIGVIHRDLKPENLLVDANWHILLTDFGTSKIVTNEEGSVPRKGSFVGTPEYMPPELVKNTESCFASDLWSLGCTLYQLICGRPPFRGVTEYLTMQKVEKVLK
jgi:3-phosphoinositide dependent protein kinase-1